MLAKAKLGPGGRLVIPAAFRKAMGLAEGEEVLLRLEDGDLTLTTRARAIDRAQEMVRRHARGDSLVADLLDERRREVQDEEAEAATGRTTRKEAG